MNLIQQLAEYQNAPIQSLEVAKRGANPQISPWVAGAILSDRIEKQKRMAMGQGAAQGPMPTVAEQQDQEVAGIMGALDAPRAQPAQQEPVMAASGGLMDAPVKPGMFDFCGGGIIAFDGGGEVDDAVYDPVTGALISGGETRRGENRTVREALGLGNEANRRALEKAEEDARKAKAPKKPRDPQEAEILRLAADVVKGGMGKGEIQNKAEFDSRRGISAPAPAAAPSAAPRAPAAGGVLSALTSSPEWADLDAARKRVFEAPKLPTTASDLAAEKAAHLKAQGITEAPWETSAKQTAELRRIMGEEDAARKKDIAANERQRRYDTFVANLGTGSFGQSAQGGLRANLKRVADQEAEDQRIKELRYNQNLRLNEIDAKAQELRYNEATGDVAAAQKNRQEIAALKRQYEKDQAAIAQGQAGVRERAAAADAQNATTLAAANIRASQGANAETKAAIQALKAQKDSINARFAKDMLYKRTPQGKADAAELLRIERKLAEMGGLDSTMPAGGGPSLSASDQALINKYLPKK